MAIIDGLKNRCKRVHYGLDTRGEFFLQYLDRIAAKFFRKTTTFYYNARVKRLAVREENAYRIRDVKLPITNTAYDSGFWSSVYDDIFWVYTNSDDNYSEEIFDLCDKFLPEGPYGLVNNRVNVTVEAGDVVIDAGSGIGDFAAYASVKGAEVYAFEPSERFKYLSQTAELNGHIIPVKKGLGDENRTMELFIGASGDIASSGSFIVPDDDSVGHSQAETVRLDDFVRENNLPRVDFIKSDIEGFERRMLAGAQETLARFAPKLALCTYHLPDDPQVMAELILKANPKYNIVQKRMKLFASVPE